MCGIYGTKLIYNDSHLRVKLGCTSFRGYDQKRWEFFNLESEYFLLGHNRSKVIDLDSKSNQPSSYKEAIEIVFNGEIYTYHEITYHFQKKAYTFKTPSEPEAICPAYLKYGESCVTHIDGIFTFVIYDKNKKRLFGALDRLEKIPFYYHHDVRDFEISSQVS